MVLATHTTHFAATTIAVTLPCGWCYALFRDLPGASVVRGPMAGRADVPIKSFHMRSIVRAHD